MCYVQNARYEMWGAQNVRCLEYVLCPKCEIRNARFPKCAVSKSAMFNQCEFQNVWNPKCASVHLFSADEQIVWCLKMWVKCLRCKFCRCNSECAFCVPPQLSGRSPKVVALFSATNFSSYIIELLQLYDTIQIKWNYAWIHYNKATISHLMV